MADRYNHRIQVFTAEGGFVRQWGSDGSAAGEFNSPEGIAIAANGQVYVADTYNNRIQVFRPSTAQRYPKAIIVAGYWPQAIPGGVDLTGDPLWSATQVVTSNAFRALGRQGFARDEIRYLGQTQQATLDLNNDGEPDVEQPVDKSKLRSAIVDWASDASELVIFLANHGGHENFGLNPTQPLAASELKLWLDDVQDQLPNGITAVIEACYSGSFIPALATPGRRVITSGAADEKVALLNSGYLSFSDDFWNAVEDGHHLFEAYRIAETNMRAVQGQHAQLDVDGDGQPGGKTDGALAKDHCLGNCTAYAAGGPRILARRADGRLDGARAADLWVEVTSLNPLIRTQALVIRPSDGYDDPGIPVLDRPKITLVQQGTSNRYLGRYEDFDVDGVYRIALIVQDKDYAMAPVEQIVLTQGVGSPLDIDGNGAVVAASDGLMLLGHLFGFTSEHLVAQRAANCQRCTASAIDRHLATYRQVFDVDGDGEYNPLTDGLLVMRHLLGYQGEDLTQQAVSTTCARCEATAIAGYLAGLK